MLVVGAGFGGLGAAIGLDRSGETDWAVIDEGDDVGGTWRDNTYPGAACDVPSHFYSFSFAPYPDWSRSFSAQPEILGYLRRVARDHGVTDRVHLGVRMHGAAWEADPTGWRVRTSAGEVTADVLVTATGGLSGPRLPDLEGLAGFDGPVSHTARCDHDTDLTGLRVAVIGTGASAVQVVPGIADRVAHLDLYQRTPAWVLPRTDRAFTTPERWAFRHVPGLQRLLRSAIYWSREAYVPGFTLAPALAEPARRLALAHLARQVPDRALRRRLTPSYRIGCKRILISSDYYPALTRPHVDPVTDPIAHVTERGIVTADGAEREVDAIVVATGFHATEPPVAALVTGEHGQTLAEVWADQGMAAYKGTTVHGFPNYFQLVGPNTGVGHSSMVFVIESQIAYLVDALERMRLRPWATVQPTAAAQRRWNDALQRRMDRSVWTTGGCSSWYLDADGRNTTLWPRSTVSLRRTLATFDARHYLVTGRPEAAPGESDAPTRRPAEAAERAPA